MKDYRFGKSQEDLILPRVKNFFKEAELKSTDKFSKWDFEGEHTVYELKSRNVTKNTYPTTILPADKVGCDKEQVFLFNFTDGLYYIKYNAEQFATFAKNPFRRWRAGVNDKEKPYFHIPIETLLAIDGWLNGERFY